MREQVKLENLKWVTTHEEGYDHSEYAIIAFDYIRVKLIKHVLEFGEQDAIDEYVYFLELYSSFDLKQNDYNRLNVFMEYSEMGKLTIDDVQNLFKTINKLKNNHKSWRITPNNPIPMAS
jgi:hypothetical protein